MAGLSETLAALAAANRRPVMAGGDRDRQASLREVSGLATNPGGLRMRVHAPDGLTAKPALVVALHGCTQTAQDYAEGSGWLALADRFGFVVLCPEQVRANNPNLCFNWFEPGDVRRGAGEAASIRAMIAHVVAEHDIDPARVFITGLSAGGAMANVMLAAYPEVFAAGAVIAGLPYGSAANMQEAFGAMMNSSRPRPAEAWGDAVRSASTHAGPWPRVSIWQGEEDAVVRPGVADDLVSQWTHVHGLEGAGVEQTGSAPGHRHLAWRTAGGATVVELHRIAGMGHGVPLSCATPQGCGTAGPYLLEVGVSSTLELALDWGLADVAGVRPIVDRLEKAAATPSAPLNDRTAPSTPFGLPPLAQDIGKVISDALRSAGLMR